MFNKTIVEWLLTVGSVQFRNLTFLVSYLGNVKIHDKTYTKLRYRCHYFVILTSCFEYQTVISF